jgi:hypothetical protein
MEIKDHARRLLPPQVKAARALARKQQNLIGWKRAQRTPLPVGGDRLPVIFCTWRRLERLSRTLEQLAAQDVPVQALIWNNSQDRGTVDAAVMCSGIPVAVHHSPRNIGGFGRFYLAREAAEQGHKNVVFIDDDMVFGPGTIAHLLSAYRPHSLSGWQSVSFRSEAYSSKYRVNPGEAASVVGSGGMIADTAVFRDARLFRCPRRYWFLEDIWLSYVAARLSGYDLFASPAEFQFAPSADDEHATYRALGQAKPMFRRYLIRQGWDPVPRGNNRSAVAAGLESDDDDGGTITSSWHARSPS